MDRGVAQLWLFLGDRWMDGCWFPGLPLEDNISSFLPDFIPKLNIYSLISKGNGQFIFGSPKQIINYRLPFPIIMVKSIELLKR